MQSVNLGHREVHHDDVREERARQLDRLSAAARFTGDDDVGLVFEDAPETLPHEGMIVGQEDANRFRGHVSTPSGVVVTMARGTRISTISPPPGD